MASEAWEHVESPELTQTNKDGSATTNWCLRGAGSAEEAQAYLVNVVPIAIALGPDILIRQQIKTSPIGGTLYKAQVTYGPEDDPKSEKQQEIGEFKYTFDTTGGKHKLAIARREVRSSWCYSGGNMPPDLKGAMNFDGKRVHGTEVVVPSLKFTITLLYNPVAVTPLFANEMARKTGRKNSDAWLGYLPGEVLFMGATGDVPIPTLRGQRVKPATVILNFEASENRDDIVIGSNPQPIVKKGWDYLWVRYERMESSGLDYPVPVHAYVDEVYPDLAFRPFFKFG